MLASSNLWSSLQGSIWVQLVGDIEFIFLSIAFYDYEFCSLADIESV